MHTVRYCPYTAVYTTHDAVVHTAVCTTRYTIAYTGHVHVFDRVDGTYTAV